MPLRNCWGTIFFYLPIWDWSVNKNNMNTKQHEGASIFFLSRAIGSNLMPGSTKKMIIKKTKRQCGLRGINGGAGRRADGVRKVKTKAGSGWGEKHRTKMGATRKAGGDAHEGENNTGAGGKAHEGECNKEKHTDWRERNAEYGGREAHKGDRWTHTLSYSTYPKRKK